MNKENKQIAVSKIELKIGDQKINLTLEEFRELKKVLDELFPKEYIQTWPTVITQPVYIPAPAINPFPPYHPYTSPWSIIWGGASDNTNETLCIGLGS